MVVHLLFALHLRGRAQLLLTIKPHLLSQTQTQTGAEPQQKQDTLQIPPSNSFRVCLRFIVSGCISFATNHFISGVGKKKKRKTTCGLLLDWQKVTKYYPPPPASPCRKQTSKQTNKTNTRVLLLRFEPTRKKKGGANRSTARSELRQRRLAIQLPGQNDLHPLIGKAGPHKPPTRPPWTKGQNVDLVSPNV